MCPEKIEIAALPSVAPNEQPCRVIASEAKQSQSIQGIAASALRASSQ
jgi:hypothetical protein